MLRGGAARKQAQGKDRKARIHFRKHQFTNNHSSSAGEYATNDSDFLDTKMPEFKLAKNKTNMEDPNDL